MASSRFSASGRCVFLAIALIALPACGDGSSSPTQPPAQSAPGQVTMQVTYTQATAAQNQVSPGPAIQHRMLSGTMTFTATGGPGVLGDNVSVDMEAPYFFGPVAVAVGTTRFDGQLVVDFDVPFSSRALDDSTVPTEAEFSWEFFSDFGRTSGTTVTQTAPITDPALTRYQEASCTQSEAVACLQGGRWSVRIDYTLVEGQTLVPGTALHGSTTNNTAAFTFDSGGQLEFRVRIRNTCQANGAWTVDFWGTTQAERGRVQVWDRRSNVINEYIFDGPIFADGFESGDTTSWVKSCS